MMIAGKVFVVLCRCVQYSFSNCDSVGVLLEVGLTLLGGASTYRISTSGGGPCRSRDLSSLLVLEFNLLVEGGMGTHPVP